MLKGSHSLRTPRSLLRNLRLSMVPNSAQLHPQQLVIKEVSCSDSCFGTITGVKHPEQYLCWSRHNLQQSTRDACG